MNYRVLDLFSGIGGFSLGLERAGMETIAFCEIEPYCQAVLRKHWPNVPIFDDITKLNGSDIEAIGGCDVICGGFPCQDISSAGKGAGLEGARSGLWREYSRLIGELKPRYVIVENVAALRSRGLGTVLRDLAAIRYNAEWHCIPASAIGAPHKRERIWLIAYPDETRQADNEGRQRQARPDGRQILTANFLKHWAYGWLPESPLVRVVHGLSADVDAVAALGNAVVPQIPEIIGRAIIEFEAT